jgi:hypothetical protein
MSGPSTGGLIITSDFRPHPWLRNAHLQTLFPTLARARPPLEVRRERLELSDGDFVDLGRVGEGSGPLVVLIHGLGGTFDSKYLRGLAGYLSARGFEPVLLQLRGGGPEPNRLPHIYHHGDTGDLRYLWKWLRAAHPDRPLFSVGWSLGANVLLKALGEEGDTAPLDGAVAVCAPFRLEECAERLRRGFARVYQNYLLRTLKDMVRQRHGPLPVPTGVDLHAALAARDFFEYDDAYTAPINGFIDARDYYARCSCGQFISRIRRPTLIINARDDPFMVPEILPTEESLSPQVTLELSERGGHVGFLGGPPGSESRYWLEPRITTFLREALGHQPMAQTAVPATLHPRN